MKKLNSILLVIASLFMILGFSIAPQYKYNNNKPTITVTTTFLGDLVHQVLGDSVNLNILMGPGVDPHTYQVSPSDLTKIYNSDLLIYQGIHLEGKFSEILSEIDRPGLTVLEATKDIPREQLITVSNAKGHQEYDPHIWHDPNLWTIVTRTVENQLLDLFPSLSQLIIGNSEKYIVNIDNMKQQVLDLVNQIPQAQRILITSHDAFNYFGRFTNFEVRAIQGLSTVTEASTKDMDELVELITSNNIKAVFVENSVSPKMIDSLTQAVKASGYDLKIGGSLYSDSLGDYNTNEGTYCGMYITNMTEIKNALS